MDSDESAWARIKPQKIALDGDQVVYRIAGKGPLLLLVHGMAGSSVTWRYVMPTLAERFTVLAPDLLGQGESDRPRSEYSVGAHANTLRDLLDALEHKRATVVGQSLGGGVAMQLADQFPERCERLVLVDSGGLGREVTRYLRMLTLPGFEYVFPLFCTPACATPGTRSPPGSVAPGCGLLPPGRRFGAATRRWRTQGVAGRFFAVYPTGSTQAGKR